MSHLSVRGRPHLEAKRVAINSIFFSLFRKQYKLKAVTTTLALWQREKIISRGIDELFVSKQGSTQILYFDVTLECF